MVPDTPTWERTSFRRGGGGVGLGGDACVALGGGHGSREQDEGDASVPTQPHTAPAPTDNAASQAVPNTHP